MQASRPIEIIKDLGKVNKPSFIIDEHSHESKLKTV